MPLILKIFARGTGLIECSYAKSVCANVKKLFFRKIIFAKVFLRTG